MHQALEMAGPQLTRNALMNALHSINNMEVPMLLPGITISISKTDHAPIKSMQMLRFNGSAWETIGACCGKKPRTEAGRPLHDCTRPVRHQRRTGLRPEIAVGTKKRYKRQSMSRSQDQSVANRTQPANVADRLQRLISPSAVQAPG